MSAEEEVPSPRPEARWTVIADDLTGACDTGAAFARRGLRTRVGFHSAVDFDGAQVQVLTTESRAMDAENAARAVAQAVQALGLDAESCIYKKIDSTLRGHPGRELAALMQATGNHRALVTPAFPGQGRVVRGGRVYVHGVLLEETPPGSEVSQPDLELLFGGEGNPTATRCSLIPLEALKDGPERIAMQLGQPGPVVFAADAETDADLRVLVEAARLAGLRLLCGSAGLARVLAESLPPGDAQSGVDKRDEPVLVVAGSYNPVTFSQVERARQAGMPVFCLNPDVLRVASSTSASNYREENICAVEDLNRLVVQVCEHLNQGESVIVSVANLGRLAGAETEIARGLANVASTALNRARVGGLMLTGGETAAAICRALECESIDLGGEVQPGVVWGRLAEGRLVGLPVITKAGGFGNEQTLLEAVRFLIRE